jgi:hypothetical protein
MSIFSEIFVDRKEFLPELSAEFLKGKKIINSIFQGKTFPKKQHIYEPWFLYICFY